MSSTIQQNKCHTEHPDRHGCTGGTRRTARFIRRLQSGLVQTGWGRIALHLLVALKSGHYMWHLQGIVREFNQS